MTINMTMGQILVLIVAFIVAAAAVVVVPQTTTSTFFTSVATQQQNFIAQLKSEMVVPSISNNATGTAYFQVDMEDNNKIKIKYSIIATDLDNVKAAHIHIGKEGEKNGPTIVTLYKTLRPAILFGRILSVHDIITSDILEGPLAGKKLSDLVNIINNMMAYVDIHSQEYPHGELRGQISTTTGMSS